jgi:hypothetical protein
MPLLQCNIDAKGKTIRLIYGVAFSIVGVLLIFFWANPAGGWMPWTLSLLILVGGAFMIFESRAGWCVIRAMGFKTPI